MPPLNENNQEPVSERSFFCGSPIEYPIGTVSQTTPFGTPLVPGSLVSERIVAYSYGTPGSGCCESEAKGPPAGGRDPHEPDRRSFLVVGIRRAVGPLADGDDEDR